MEESNVFKSYIHTGVLCLSNYLHYILAGIGGNLHVYANQCIKLSKQIFKDERIHKICVKDNLVLLKGGRKLVLACLHLNCEHIHCEIIFQIQNSDWIMDSVLHEKGLVSLTTAHNVFQLWNLTSGKCLKCFSCEEKCILYSCKIVGDKENNVVLSGTAFGYVLIWALFLGDRSLLLHRLKGHNGIIYSIEVNTSEKVFSTTSDDRSLKIWSITTEKPVSDPGNWEHSKIQLIHTLFGHTARVWRSLIISDFYVTVGEDSRLIIWNKDGRLVKTLVLHQGGGIRALNYLKETNMLTTGGEDGGISKICWEHVTSESMPSVILNFDQSFLSKVCFIKNGISYIQSGVCFFVSNRSKEVIFENKYFETYCVIEVSLSLEQVALGSIKGHLVLIDVETKNVVIQGQYVKGQVHSVHWLNEYLLTCGSEGRLDLWRFSSGELRNIRVMTLPKCREWWTTCGIMVNSNLIVGDRLGNLHVFNVAVGGNPIRTFWKIHSYLGVTDIKWEDNVFLTLGRDGTLKTFTNDFYHCLTYKLPMDWPWRIVKYNEDKLVLGFRGGSFVVWSSKLREVLASHDCGGGHRSCDFKMDNNKLTFLYVKKKKLWVIDFIVDKIIQVRNGFHTKEINCLRMIQTSPEIIVTGSEDTTLRISRINEWDIKEIEVLKTHSSSIRAVSVCPTQSGTVLLVSAGGKGQIVIWSFDLKSLKCQEIVYHCLTKEKRHWKSSTPVEYPDTRFMCVDVVQEENKFLIGAGCSDFQIRLFAFREDLTFLSSIPYSHCVLNIAFLKEDGKTFLASFGTDGRVVFWDVTDPCDVQLLHGFSIHFSGINSFHFEPVQPGKFVLATGGDDNLISISLVQISTSTVELRQQWKNSTTHSCQITGIKMINSFLITTSIDQRITFWKWTLNKDNIGMKFLYQYMTAVPDIQGIDASWYDEDTLRLIVYGKGIQTLKINVCSLNRDNG